MTAPLLIEIGLEELPPAAMRPLAETFAESLAARLAEAGITHGAVRALATPRRITAQIADVAKASAAETIEKSGPTLAIAYDADGNPTRAGEGFARSVGVAMSELSVEDSDKGQRLVYRGTVAGQPLNALIQPAVDAALRSLPIPKRMRWGESEHAFVRPVHWVVALHGETVLDLCVFDVTADRHSRGHRFHHPETLTLDRAEDYEARLESPGHVIVDMARRQALVESEVHRGADSLDGTARIDPALVEEVIALVEWPVAIAGRFDARYLELPPEVLIATLEGHQRYFPVQDDQGRLIAGFVTLANIDSRDPAQVVAGNERVVDPRLSDALFFWNADRRVGLEARVSGLAGVSFQQALGSLADKSDRVARLAAVLAGPAGADTDHVAAAARLAKADLLTEMVDEFPELQGLMGSYYARHENLPTPVADAIVEHYAPAAAGAAIAASPAGRALALADRLDTLAGIFAIDKRPSGDKDPFGLRRAALGLVRTLIEADIRIDLPALINTAVSAQPVTPAPETSAALWQFLQERLRGYYLDQGVSPAEFEAVSGMGLHDVVDLDRRIHAVREFARLPEAGVVCSAHKRIRNILRRNAEAGIADRVVVDLLDEPAEQALHDALERQRADIASAAENARYTQALAALAPLAEPLDAFFDQVMVMTDDDNRRGNRLALLQSIDALCRQVADISCLSVESAA